MEIPSLSTPTTFMNVTVVLTVGIVNDNDEFSILPFHKVDLYDETGRCKTLLVNYTFGKPSDEDKRMPAYEGEMGLIKQLVFARLSSQTPVIIRLIQGESGAEIERKITETLYDESVPPNAKILFVFPRAVSGEDPFYRALNLTDPRRVPSAASLEDLGLTVDEPFKSVSLEELRGYGGN